MAVPSILICAAGSARRMRGGDKLLEPVQGVPLLARLAAAAQATGLAVRVTLAPGRAARAAALDGLGVTRIAVPEADEGMAASLRRGAAAASAAGEAGLLVMLGDMPEIGTDDLQALLQAFRQAPDRVYRATAEDGTPGHPVLFPARLFPALGALTGDRGAKSVLEAETVVPVALPGRRALTDLDTPEDWARWRAATGG